jgi:hypothetical protein
MFGIRKVKITHILFYIYNSFRDLTHDIVSKQSKAMALTKDETYDWEKTLETFGSCFTIGKPHDMETEMHKLEQFYKDSPAKTQRTYKDNYVKVSEAYCNGLCDLDGICLEDMVLLAGQMSQSYASQKAYLNVWSICNFKLKGQPVSESYKKYMLHVEEKITEQMKISHKTKLETVASQEDILAHEERMYTESRWSAYVACRIVRELLCRNKDLNLTVIDYDQQHKIEFAVKTSYDNWFVIRGKEISVVRNDYKTCKKYGCLTNKLVADKKLLEACKHLRRDELLFPGADTASKLQNRLKNSLFTNEVGYLHASIQDIRQTGDLNRLREIAATRGSSVDQLLTSYNLEYLEENNDS